jgi:hypothetical protein
MAQATIDPPPVPGSQFLLIALLGVGAALCYAAALARFPLLAIYAQPIQNLEKLTNSDPWAGLALAVWTCLLFGGYALGALSLYGASRPRSTASSDEQAPRFKPQAALLLVLIGFPLVFLALLLLVYPTTSVDLYDYMFRGRMLVRYQANTFVQVPIDFKSDPLFWYVAWRRAVTAYGPLWEGLSWLTARLAGERPLAALAIIGVGAVPKTELDALQRAELLRLMLAYKGLAALGFLGCGAAIWAVLRRTAPRWRWLGLYLWLWNPLALWESIAAGHNDAWMAMLILLAVGLMVPSPGAKEIRRQADRLSTSLLRRISLPAFVGSFLALTAGGLVKFLALMFGPVLLCAALRQLPSWRERLRLIAIGGLACAAVVVAAYMPFWAGWATLRNFSDRGTLFTSSWLAVLQAPISLGEVRGLISTRDVLGLLTPGDQSEATAQTIAVSIGLGLLVFGVLWAAWRAWRAPEEVAAHALWLLLWFLFVCNPWFQPWYLLWALALLAVQPWRGRIALVVGLFCCTAMLSYLPGVFLLPLLGWNVDGAEWNALTSALIYGPPLLALLSGRRPGLARLRRRERLPRTIGAREEEVVG